MSGRWGFLEAYGYRRASGWTLPEPCASLPAVMPLPHLASWALAGQGAGAFLQGYVTSDLANISSDEWRVTCFCSIKGRVLATAFVSGTASEVRFVMREAMIAPLIESLSKYLAFARSCTLSREPTRIFGCIGDFSTATGATPLRLETGPRLGLVLAADAQGASGWRQLAASGATADQRLWSDYEIQAGFVHIETQTRDTFLPQMLGLEHFAAVSYTKGCYLGQEIIVRAAHRGRVKRHLAQVAIDAAQDTTITLGHKIHDARGREAGMVVAWAPVASEPRGLRGLAVLSGTPSAPLHLADSELEVRVESEDAS